MADPHGLIKFEKYLKRWFACNLKRRRKRTREKLPGGEEKFWYLTLSSQASRDITSGSQAFRNITSRLRIVSIHDIFTTFTLFTNFLILFNLAVHIKWPLYPYLIHQSKSQVSHDWIGLLFNLSSVRAARNDCLAEERRPPLHPVTRAAAVAPLARLCAAAPGEPRLAWSVALIVIVVLCRITCPRETDSFARELKERSWACLCRDEFEYVCGRSLLVQGMTEMRCCQQLVMCCVLYLDCCRINVADGCGEAMAASSRNLRNQCRCTHTGCTTS